MFDKLKEWYRCHIKRHYKLEEVFGMQEKPPQPCQLIWNEVFIKYLVIL